MLVLSPTCPGAYLQSTPQQTPSLKIRFVGDNTNKGEKTAQTIRNQPLPPAPLHFKYRSLLQFRSIFLSATC
jgi:hypothetical protein